ncbi:MAG: hypothetical protein A3F89_02100 [Deltaproteobacteria bacterium RIFCSPLOWO2_12_FULL_50_11]|nr:MAG: hypothetical protein A3F89_02100 [Deltaproteobacteria bacterium RIFCSPLOWO2_12_FULL_50_11]
MSWTDTLLLRTFGWLRIPLIALVQPKVICLTKERTEIKIPLNYVTKNHLNCMYFGALTIGADCTGGLFALHYIHKTGNKINFLFKDFKADFLRRAESDVHFINKEGPKIITAIKQAIKTGERINKSVHITAITPKVSGNDPVARFALTLSLKVKKQ